MDAFSQDRTARRARRLGISQLACIGRHTISGLLCTAGRHGRDWSGDYRFFSQSPWESRRLFGPVLEGMWEMYPSGMPFVTGMDDTLLKKTGAHIPGVAYRRDPLSPPFATNFIRGQRFLQVSGMLPEGPATGAARAIPLQYRHVPPAPKPKKSDPPEVWKAYRLQCRRQNLSTAGCEALAELREDLDQLPGGSQRILAVGVDGSYTNQTVLKRLPPRTTLIGRIRKDAKLSYPPTPQDQAPRGTRRQYGGPAPTPRELLQDDSAPWRDVQAYASGKLRTFRVKTLGPVLWAKAGAARPLRLVVIAPVGYRLHAGGKLLYRQPAYLICTDVDLNLERILQYYLWRWDIEVNHRDEKQFIGVGQAQVRAPASADRDPPFGVACYAMLLLASAQTYGLSQTSTGLPLPKWRQGHAKTRLTTQDLIAQLRKELWGHALNELDNHSNHFVNASPTVTKCPESQQSLAAAVLLAATG